MRLVTTTCILRALQTGYRNHFRVTRENVHLGTESLEGGADGVGKT